MSAATTREGIEVAMQEAAVVLVPCPSCGRSVPESNMGLHLAAGCGGGGGGEAGTDRRSRSVSAVSSPLPTAPPLERNGVPDPPRLARAEPHRSASLRQSGGDAGASFVHRHSLSGPSPPPSILRRRRGRSDAGGSSNLDASDVASSWATSSDATTTAANRCPSETSGRTSSTSSSTTFRSSQASLPPSEQGEEEGEEEPSRDVIDLCAADDGNAGTAEAVVAEEAEWACPRCTLLNSPGEGSCAACGFWNVAGATAGATTGGGGDGVRAADPTQTERLLDADDFGFGGASAPLPEPITLNDYVRTIRSSIAVDRANADRDRLERQRQRQQPAPPSLPSAPSPTRMASGGALLGATLGAANAYVRGRPTGMAAFEGAVSGAMGGALVGEVLRDVLPPSPLRHTAEEGATTAAAAAEAASLEQSRTGPATGQPGYPTPEDATTAGTAPRRRERPTPRRSVRVVRRPDGRGGYVTSTTTTFEDFATTMGAPDRRNEFATSEEMLDTLLGSIAMSPHGFHESNVPGHARLPLLSGRRIEDMSYEQLLDAFGDGSENRARGADASIVENLPVATLEDVERELPEGARNCAICLEEFENGDQRRTLPCLHGFHADCVDRWLRGNGCCPVCKHAVG